LIDKIDKAKDKAKDAKKTVEDASEEVFLGGVNTNGLPASFGWKDKLKDKVKELTNQ